MPKKSGIPDRWLDYSAVGKRIKSTKFITFKVPLNQRLCSKVDISSKFTPEDLMRHVANTNLHLGLVIDLTNTTRYYDPKEFENAGVQYKKIFTEGHVVPSNDVIMRFAAVVDQFLQNNCDNDKIIGVHCTHGVNRTGYLVCRYMIDRMTIQPEVAIESYRDGRGYPIERVNYIEDLLSGVKMDERTYRLNGYSAQPKRISSNSATRHPQQQQQQQQQQQHRHQSYANYSHETSRNRTHSFPRNSYERGYNAASSWDNANYPAYPAHRGVDYAYNMRSGHGPYGYDDAFNPSGMSANFQPTRHTNLDRRHNGQANRTANDTHGNTNTLNSISRRSAPQFLNHRTRSSHGADRHRPYGSAPHPYGRTNNGNVHRR